MLHKYPVYDPDEDSYLLAGVLKDELNSLKQTTNLSSLSLLDMGSGSGYLGNIALKKKLSVTFADINPKAIELLTKKFSKNNQATVIETDLFNNIPFQKFDLIVFNTPYLPDDEELIDPSLHGGPKGYEVTMRFLKTIKLYLKKTGVLIFLISTLTHQDVIEAKLYDLSLDFKILAKKKLFFEELLVYRVNFR